MAKELNIVTGETGQTLVATPYLLTVAKTPIAMTEYGTSGVYWGDMTGVVGIYEIIFSESSNTVGGGQIVWSGTAEITVADTPNLVWDEDIINHTDDNTMGYEQLLRTYDGCVHFREGGESGAVYPYGTAEMPVGNLADALTIAALYSITKIHIEGSIFINSEDITGKTFIADRSLSNSVTINSMVNTGACYFTDLTVSGDLTGATRFTTCVLGALTGFNGGAKNSLLTGNVEITGTGANYLTDCDTYVTDDSSFKSIDVGANLLNIIRCRGNYEITDKTGVSDTSIDLASGTISVASSCITGEIVIQGIAEVVDNSHVLCTVTNNALSKETVSIAVWDEPLTGDTHNLPTSAGRRLRTTSSVIITEGEVVSSTINTITLNGAASAETGAYDPSVIAITEGVGLGQCRGILEYDGNTRIAIIDRNWKTQPDETSVYIISMDSGREHINEGLARGGGTNTITLNALAADIDDTYIGQTIFIRSGKGEDQACKILSYNGTTKQVTICRPWGEVPDDTSGYVILPSGVLTKEFIANTVWSYNRDA